MHCADSISESLSEMKTLIASLKQPLKQGETRDAAHKQLDELLESSIDAVQTISQCSAHQKRITDDILSLSKLDSNLLQISPSTLRARELLEHVRKSFGTEAERAGVTVKTETHKSVQEFDIDWIKLDPGRVLQVLVNLITNAVKFTKNKSGTRTVTVRIGASKKRPTDLPVDYGVAQDLRDSVYDLDDLEENEYYLWFTVEDTGCGMTAEEKAKIFSRFVQANPRTYSEYGGSGLGLFISRKLVELQGGEIGFASEAGLGSTFAFYVKTVTTGQTKQDLELPVLSRSSAPADTAPLKGAVIQANGDADQANGETTQRSVIVAAADLNVLIVEDNLVNQRVLKKQLLKHGYKVHTADNGQEALDLLKTTRLWKPNPTSPKDVDIILMDVEMPIMDGLTCAKTIRDLELQGEITTHVPIIAVSANARPEQIKQALDTGMDEAISKPFRIADITPRIHVLVEEARERALHARQL